MAEKALTADLGGLCPRRLDPLGRRSRQGHGRIRRLQSQISRLCEEIDEKAKAFLGWPIGGGWPYLDRCHLPQGSPERLHRLGGRHYRRGRKRRRTARGAGHEHRSFGSGTLPVPVSCASCGGAACAASSSSSLTRMRASRRRSPRRRTRAGSAAASTSCATRLLMRAKAGGASSPPSSPPPSRRTTPKPPETSGEKSSISCAPRCQSLSSS